MTKINVLVGLLVIAAVVVAMEGIEKKSREPAAAVVQGEPRGGNEEFERKLDRLSAAAYQAGLWDGVEVAGNYYEYDRPLTNGVTGAWFLWGEPSAKKIEQLFEGKRVAKEKGKGPAAR